MATAIFGFERSASHAPKIHISHTELPTTYLNPAQPPTHKSPWRQIHSNPFIRDLRIIIPTRHLSRLHQVSKPIDLITTELPTHRYAKVITTLGEILADDDLRRGEYVLLSVQQDPASASTTFSLNRGVLVIDMPRHVYERSGLTFPVPAGEKVKSGARKHDRRSERRRIQANLREASMVKGKKGFDRLVWAAKNVDELREARVWLFTQIEAGDGLKKGVKRKRGEKEETQTETESKMHAALEDTTMPDIGAAYPSGRKGTEILTEPIIDTTKADAFQPATASVDSTSSQKHPLSSHHPTLVTRPASLSFQTGIQVPSTISHPHFLNPLHDQKQHNKLTPKLDEDDVHELSSSLSTLFLPLPHLHSTPPTLTADDSSQTDSNTSSKEDLALLNWSGLVPQTLILHILIDLITKSRSHDSTQSTDDHTNDPLWAAIQVVNHRIAPKGQCDGYTILLHSEHQPSHLSSSSSKTETDEQHDHNHNHTKSTQTLQETLTGKAKDREKQATGMVGFKYTTCLEYFDNTINS